MHRDERMTGRTSQLPAFLGLTFALTWLAWGLANPGLQRALGISIPPRLLIGLGTAVPSTVALAMAVRQGTADTLLARLFHWRVHPGWYVVAILGPAVLMLAATAGHALLGGTVPPYPPLALWPLVAVNFGLVVLVGGPLGEELGWRGLALPLLP